MTKSRKTILYFAISCFSSFSHLTASSKIDQTAPLSAEEKNTIAVTSAAYSSLYHAIKYGKAMQLYPGAHTAGAMSHTGARRICQTPGCLLVDLVQLPISLITLPYTEMKRRQMQSLKETSEILKEARDFRPSQEQAQPHLRKFHNKLLHRYQGHPNLETIDLATLSEILRDLEKKGKLIARHKKGLNIYQEDFHPRPQTYRIPRYFPVYSVFRPLSTTEILDQIGLHVMTSQ